MKLPKHIALTLDHNDHKTVYQSAADWIAEQEATWLKLDDWTSPEERARAIETDEIWHLSWCPDTPVGSCVLLASTLDALLAAIDP